MPRLLNSPRSFVSLFVAGAALASAVQSAAAADVPVAGSPAARHGTVARSAAPAPTDTLHLVFALSSARRASVDKFVRSQYDPASPNYHHWLTPDQFGARFGAAASDIATVTQYARLRGFQIARVWPNRLFISVDACAADAERAFGVRLRGYLRPRSEIAAGLSPTFRAPDRAPAMPPAVAAHVEALFGLSTETAAQSALAKCDGESVFLSHPTVSMHGVTANFSDRSASPADLASFYGFDQLHLRGQHGEGQSIAVFSPTTHSEADFSQFEAIYGLGSTMVTTVTVNGGATDAAGTDEAALDLDVIAGQAPGAHIYLYESPNDYNLDVWNQITSDNIPVVSNSWGKSEQSLSQALVNSQNTIFQQMAAQGQSMFVPSGDQGAFDGNAVTPSVDFPASSPFVTAVGGTAAPVGGSEIAWSGSGGGPSAYFAAPSWQTGPGVANASSNGFRQVPDIAALASPQTPGYNIYTGGSLRGFGGTSASTPLWAAANVLFNQGANARTGQLAPLLYQFGSDPARAPIAFNDIVQGDNGRYGCTLNWDFVTGWGSPKVAGIYSLLTTAGTGSPAPFLFQLTPNSVPAGTPSLLLTATGAHFTAASVVNWNGAALATQFVSETTVTATVPAALLASIGTTNVTVTDPAGTLVAGPLPFTVTTSHPFSAGLQMISAPFDSTGNLFTSLLGSDIKIATWDANMQQYTLSPSAPADTFHLGRAYWARFAAPTNLLSTGTIAIAPYSVALAAGWNMIADPFSADTSVEALKVSAGGTTTSFTDAVNSGAVGALYLYDSTKGYYVPQSGGALNPYAGYWLHATQPCALIFPAPAL